MQRLPERFEATSGGRPARRQSFSAPWRSMGAATGSFSARRPSTHSSGEARPRAGMRPVRRYRRRSAASVQRSKVLTRSYTSRHSRVVAVRCRYLYCYCSFFGSFYATLSTTSHRPTTVHHKLSTTVPVTGTPSRLKCNSCQDAITCCVPRVLFPPRRGKELSDLLSVPRLLAHNLVCNWFIFGSCRSATMLKNKFYKLLRAEQGLSPSGDKKIGKTKGLSVDTSRCNSVSLDRYVAALKVAPPFGTAARRERA